VNIHLDERRVTDAFEAVHLAGFDDQNVTRSGFEFFTVNVVQPASFSNELNLVLRMAMRSGTSPR
jgi:hypothetical protein